MKADIGRIDSGTFHRMAPELTNLWAVDTMINYAKQVGGELRGAVDAGEAFSWGVAWAMRAEALRIDGLLQHFRKAIDNPSPGEKLAQRLVATVRSAARAARTEWRRERWR